MPVTFFFWFKRSVFALFFFYETCSGLVILILFGSCSNIGDTGNTMHTTFSENRGSRETIILRSRLQSRMSVGNSKRLNLRLEENYKSRREVMRTLLKFLATSLAKMNSESIQDMKAKMLISQAHEKLKAVMAEAEKPWTLGQLALQRIEELQLPLKDLPEG